MRASIPTITDISAAAPNRAVLVARFGDLGIIRGEWKVVGQLPNWSRGEWPVPHFMRKDLVSGHGYIVKYSDDLQEIDIEKVPDNRATTTVPEDGLFGSGAVEITLAKRLKAPA